MGHSRKHECKSNILAWPRYWLLNWGNQVNARTQSARFWLDVADSTQRGIIFDEYILK